MIAPSRRVKREMHMIWRYRIAARGALDFVSPVPRYHGCQAKSHHRNAWQAQHRLLPFIVFVKQRKLRAKCDRQGTSRVYESPIEGRVNHCDTGTGLTIP
jgi:hypothetical protein